MAKAKTNDVRRDGQNADDPSNEEDRGLLSRNSTDDEEEDIVVHPGRSSPTETPRTPRTPNRVRFDLPPAIETDLEGNNAPPPYIDSPLSGRRDPRPRASLPLHTDI